MSSSVKTVSTEELKVTNVEEVRKTGIPIIDSVPWGTHLCQFYQTKQDLIDILVPYFKAGLENNEFCMWVTSEPLSKEETEEAMRKALPNFDLYLKRGQIEIVPHTEWYLRRGAFDLQRVLNGWIDKLNQALAKGYDGIRVTGNTAWLEKRDWKNFVDYEKEVNDCIGKYRMIAICTYSLDKCGASEAIDVVRNHQFALIKRRGECELIQSSEFKRAKEALRRSEMQLKNVFAASPDAIAVTDLNGNIVECNQAALNMLAISSKAELIGKSGFPFIAKKDQQKAMRYLKNIIEKGSMKNVQYTLLTKDGREFFAELSASVIKDSSGNPTGFVAITKDITERKRAEEKIRKEKEFTSSLLKGLKEGFAVIDKEGKQILVNDELCKMTGYSEKELLNQKPPFKYWAEEGLKDINEAFEKTLKGVEGEYELTFKRKDGERFIALISPRKTLDPDGNTIFFATVKDITQRKKVEDEIRKFKTILDNANYGVAIADLDGNLAYVNEYFAAVHGYEPDEIIGKSLRIFHNAEQLKQVIEINRKLQENGSYGALEVWHTHKDGSVFPMLMNGVIIKNHKGKPLFMATTAIDITKRKQTQERIRESEEKFRNLFEHARDVIITFDLKGNVTSTNNAIAEYGFKQDEIIGKNMLKFVSKRYWPKLLKELVKIAQGNPLEGEIEMITPEGKKIAEYRSNPIRKGKKVVGIQTILRDITERKRFEKRLSALNAYSRSLIMAESMEEIYQLTLDAIEKTLGFEHAAFMVVDKNMLCVADQRGYPKPFFIKLPLDGSKRGITAKAAKTGKPVLVPDTKKEREYIEGIPNIRSELAVPIKIRNRVLGVLNVESKRLDAFNEKDQKLLEILASHAATAISNLKYAKNLEKLVQERTRELRKTQDRLLKAERLVAIGELAAMVGHDLRNPLQSIENAIYYLKNECAPKLSVPIPQKAMEMLQVINDSVNYADRIIRDLQDFSAPKKPRFEKININALVKETLSQVEKPENVELITELDHLPQIEADKDMMKRVFLNLAVNGIQAIENGGTLKVATKKTKGFIEVNFKDTGVGISKENMEKLFTPFFTTKAKGIGMGLAICKRFIESHGGNIEVKSEEGEGTTFTVKLPPPAEKWR